MTIASLVVHTAPTRTAAVRAELAALPGVEVHTATGDGKLVVTVDRADESEAAETLLSLHRVPGVIAAALVYSHFEPATASEGTAP